MAVVKSFDVGPVGVQKNPQAKPFIKPIETHLLAGRATDKSDELLMMLEGEWMAAAHWVYKKKWHPQHKIPGPKKLRDLYEPKGDFLLAILNLCEALKTIRAPYSDHYQDTADWFGHIAQEIKYGEYQRLGQESKSIEIKKGRENVRILFEEQENPYSPEKEIHVWRFVQSALCVIKRAEHKSIEIDFWRGSRKGKHKGLKHAMTAYIALMESKNICPVKMSGGKILAHLSRGNYWEPLILNPEPSKPKAEKLIHQGL